MELKDVTKRYPDFTLDRVSLALPRGCIMGLVGENGAGKSTTIQLILGLIRRDGGEISVLGQSGQKGMEEARERLGVALDESCFPESLSAKDIHTVMKHIYKGWDSAQFDRLCRRFSLPEGKAVREYSRGMKMKLSIAAALSHQAELLILDEATSGLDPVVRDEILDVFLEFIQDERHSILVSSHIVSDLEKICDYIALLHRGRLLFSEPKDELVERYGLLKCSERELAQVAPSAVKAVRRHSFGVEALVERAEVPRGYTVDRAGLEDIILYSIKEGASV